MLRGVETPLAPEPGAVRPAAPVSGPAFGEAIGRAVRETAERVQEGEAAAKSFAAGEIDAVETVLALSRAELALRHLTSVRNRLIEAYQEVMRLPL